MQVFGKIYQARYLAGMVTARDPLVQASRKVGYVNAYRIGETVRGANAFVRGLHAVDPGIEVPAFTSGWVRV